MRIIFLDVDGVLNNSETEDKVYGFIGIDPKLVKNLKKLYDKSNEEEETRIVISSSWKIDQVKADRHKNDGYVVNENCYAVLLDRLAKAGMQVLGPTPESKINPWHRDEEILTWLETNEDKNISTWVILDDEEFEFFKNERTKDYIIQTNGVNGLTEENVENALKILRGE